MNHQKGKLFFQNKLVHKLFQRFLNLLNSSNEHRLIEFTYELKLKYSVIFQSKKFFSIDGIIGSGKSHIIDKHFKQGNKIIDEPVDLWMLIMCEKREGFCKNAFSEYYSRLNKKSNYCIQFFIKFCQFFIIF